MMTEQNGDALQLPDLFITNFRGIKNLTVPRLGRVTLVAGQNGVGKSTVLDAVKVYAARAVLRTAGHIKRPGGNIYLG